MSSKAILPNKKIVKENEEAGPVHIYTPAELEAFAKSRRLEVSNKSK